MVDYAILSPLVFSMVMEFRILPFDLLISDVHCGIHISLCCQPENTLFQEINTDESDTVKRAFWDANAQDLFLQNLNNDNINQLIDHMDSLNENVSKETVQLITTQCSSLLCKAADAAGMIKQINPRPSLARKKSKPTRPWFNAECRGLQKDFRRAKNMRRRTNNHSNMQALTEASKAYKKCVNKQFKIYQKDFIKKLRNLKSADPKSYWGFLNKTEGSRSSTMQKVSLETFAEHFKKLNTVSSENLEQLHTIGPLKVLQHNFELNIPITEQEVLKRINSLKMNKACATDLILNEFLKSSKSKMLTAFTKLFNTIFNSGHVPVDWSQGIISPIYKNKGDKASPDNYRGITILSCFGKLFTAVLNNRLNKYLEDMHVLAEEQAGFRKGYGTTDHIFNLKCLIDIYLFRGRKLFCAFIDYKKAFDSVNRTYLWQKLL